MKEKKDHDNKNDHDITINDDITIKDDVTIKDNTNQLINLEESIKTSKSEDFIFLNKGFSKENISQPNNEAMIEQTIEIEDTLNGDQITSSPTITFGQETINMIDEFIDKESQQKKKKSAFERFIEKLKCC